MATAQVALRQGQPLAAQLEAEFTGRPRRPFHFRLLGEMVPLSRHTAVAGRRVIHLTGFLAWFMWKTVFLPISAFIRISAPEEKCPPLSANGGTSA